MRGLFLWILRCKARSEGDAWDEWSNRSSPFGRRPMGPARLGGRDDMCTHNPRCPDLSATDCCNAQVVSNHLDDQGWCRLCNGVIWFDDGHYLTPDGHDHTIALS